MDSGREGGVVIGPLGQVPVQGLYVGGVCGNALGGEFVGSTVGVVRSGGGDALGQVVFGGMGFDFGESYGRGVFMCRYLPP